MTYLQTFLQERQYNAVMALLDRVERLPITYKLPKGASVELDYIRGQLLDLSTDLARLRQEILAQEATK